MTDYIHFISQKDINGDFKNFITTNKYAYDTMPDMGEFWRYLNSLGDNDSLEEIAIEIDMSKEDTAGLIGYIMPEDWKFQLVDKCASEIDIKKIDKYIGEIGIRLAFRYACECEFYEEEDFKEALSTDAGVRRLFYAILWGLIDINDKGENDDETYITEYNEEDYMEQMSPDDDEVDDNYEFAIPVITDEAFVKIGVATPSAA